VDAILAGGRSPIAAVWPGMPVVDITGTRVGTVALVTMGDHEAVTAPARPSGPGRGLVRAVAETFRGREPDVPPVIAARLRRTGFVKINVPGLFARSRYAASDQVAGVEDGSVRLATLGTALVRSG